MGSHRFVRSCWTLLLGVLLCGVAGCPPPGEDLFQDGPPRYPMRSTEEIIAGISQNAGKLDKALWSPNVTVAARFTDADDKRHNYNLEGSLLFQKSQNLRIDLRPGLGSKVMGIGSNPEEYWLWVEPDVGVMHWGRYANVGKPCVEKISIRPDQLSGALGLEGLPKPGSGLNGPARKTAGDTEPYDLLEYFRPQVNSGATIDREYWIDRKPPYQIRMVHFRDDQGRISMTAHLNKYGPTWEGGPVVAHEVKVEWPNDAGEFTISIGSFQGKTPEQIRPTAFVRPRKKDLPAGVKRIIQVDASCDTPAAAPPNPAPDPPAEPAEPGAAQP